MQCVVVCCSVMQYVAVRHRTSSMRSLQVDLLCSVLQCVAVCCSALQYVAVRCSKTSHLVDTHTAGWISQSNLHTYEWVMLRISHTRSFLKAGFRPRVHSFVWFVPFVPGFDPVSTLLFDFYHYFTTERTNGFEPEHAPRPSSQVVPGFWVRYPLGSKKVLLRNESLHTREWVTSHSHLHSYCAKYIV